MKLLHIDLNILEWEKKEYKKLRKEYQSSFVDAFSGSSSTAHRSITIQQKQTNQQKEH